MSLENRVDDVAADQEQTTVISLDDCEIEVTPAQRENRSFIAQRTDDSWAANSDNRQNFQNN